MAVLAGFGHGFSLEEKLNRPTFLTEDACYTVASDIESVAPGTILRHRRPPSPIAGLVGLSTTTETQLQLFSLFVSTIPRFHAMLIGASYCRTRSQKTLLAPTHAPGLRIAEAALGSSVPDALRVRSSEDQSPVSLHLGIDGMAHEHLELRAVIDEYQGLPNL